MSLALGTRIGPHEIVASIGAGDIGEARVLLDDPETVHTETAIAPQAGRQERRDHAAGAVAVR